MVPAKVANHVPGTMPEEQLIPEEGNEEESKKEDVHDILPLIYILLKNPPPDHDFTTCPICKEYGITEL